MGSWTEEGALLNFSSPPPLLDTADKFKDISWFDETRTFLNLFSQARKSSSSGSLIFFPAATDYILIILLQLLMFLKANSPVFENVLSCPK